MFLKVEGWILCQSSAKQFEFQRGLLGWYEFPKGASVLFVGQGSTAITRFLSELDIRLTVTSLESSIFEDRSEIFDYIIAIEALEQVEHPEKVLFAWRRLLHRDGCLLLGMNNRLGIRYFCGDRDIYTGRNFDGIEEYRRAYGRKADVFQGRMYAREEIRRMLNRAGFPCRFYSVLSDLDHPALIYAEDYQPKEDLTNRVFPTYHSPETIFLEELPLYHTLVKEGLFHEMANSYLVECPLTGRFSSVLHVTSSAVRAEKDAFYTIIYREKMVEKKAAYPAGQERLAEIAAHHAALRVNGIQTVEDHYENGCYTMPYIEAESGLIYLKRLMNENQEKLLEVLNDYRALLLRSSRVVREDEQDGPILAEGYFDLVPWNAFIVDGKFVFYDQEFMIQDYPMNVIFLRVLSSLYGYGVSQGAMQRLPYRRLLAHYGIEERAEKRWNQMQYQLLRSLRREEVYAEHYAKVFARPEIIHSNRQRMNFSEEDYERLFVNIFDKADTRKLVLFGSGKFAKKFLEIYASDYPVYAIVDNSESRWDKEVDGVRISSPVLLKKFAPAEFKVIICIKNYTSVIHQLKEMGISSYSVFDPARSYPRKRTMQSAPFAVEGRKKYHVGYIAGCFDLFHIGHLNMFRRAKEMCDYLIVGVVSDEGMQRFKKKKPFIPLQERLEIVRSCRYVDQAEEIPVDFNDTEDAWKMYHFDVQFSGSDYEMDPIWQKKREFLRSHGSDLIFFSYTQGTSSTELQALIRHQLLSLL